MIPSNRPRELSDFSHQNLDGFDFRGLDLRYADFHGSSLVGARFDGALLHGANFVDTNVNSANFTDCEFFEPSEQFTEEHFIEIRRDAELSIEFEVESRNTELFIDSFNMASEEPYTPLSLDSIPFYDLLFTTRIFVNWPDSDHNREKQQYSEGWWPYWVDPLLFYDCFERLPVCELAYDLPFPWFAENFYPEEFLTGFLTLWKSFSRSFYMHNSAACFDPCEYNSSTIWPHSGHLADYPIWNSPPLLEWSLGGLSHYWEDWGWVSYLSSECMICTPSLRPRRLTWH